MEVLSLKNDKVFAVSQSVKCNVTMRMIVALALVVTGAIIYMLFRDKTILIFKWIDIFHLDNALDYCRNLTRNITVPDFVKFCVPDGLWLASYILVMDTIWHNEDLGKQLFWCLLLPAISILSEIMQYFGMLVGTYDFGDLVCYSMPVALYLIYKYYEKKS